jgi:predicted ATPase
MRIAISGTSCMGKSTLISDFLKEWPSYSTTKTSYREVLKEKNTPHSDNTTKDTQWAILNFMIDELQKTTPKDKIIFDRCPIDNLVYSIWANGKGVGDIDDEFIKKCLPIVKESLRQIDVIFYIPITKVARTPEIVDDGFRSINKTYRTEIDNIFQIISMEARDNPESPFFSREDRPPMIEIFGEPRERIEMMKLYIDAEGDPFEEGQSLISEEMLEVMERYGAGPIQKKIIT